MSDNEKMQAVLYKSFTSDSNFSNLFNVISNTISSNFNEIKAEYEAKKMQISKDNNWLLKVLNFTKIKFMKKISEFNFPSISFRKKLYLKREYPEITIEYINELLNFIY